MQSLWEDADWWEVITKPKLTKWYANKYTRNLILWCAAEMPAPDQPFCYVTVCRAFMRIRFAFLKADKAY